MWSIFSIFSWFTFHSIFSLLCKVHLPQQLIRKPRFTLDMLIKRIRIFPIDLLIGISNQPFFSVQPFSYSFRSRALFSTTKISLIRAMDSSQSLYSSEFFILWTFVPICYSISPSFSLINNFPSSFLLVNFFLFFSSFAFSKLMRTFPLCASSTIFCSRWGNLNL